MGIPISNVTRRVVYAASGTGPYSFTFEILANTDVAVYKDDALLTLTTDYTVTINSNGTGYITLTASPTGATQIAIVGNRTIQRTTDFVTGGDFFANTVNDEMDQQTIFAQQNAEGLQRALQAPQTDPTTIDMTLPRASIRANKVLSFDADGNPSATEFIGSNRGNWASGTLYYVRDIIKDTSTSNIWQCVTEHTSSGSQPIGTNADAAKWFLLVDAAAAGASATAAAASASAAATSASSASTSATNAASSASTASTQASNASTSASNAASSATAAASSASSASTAATNAGNSATAAATSATNASNSASSASTSATNASNSATSAATSASQASTSASNAASSASTATTQASNAATSATNAANSATASANSATAAAASAAAAAASFDAFDDIYLGAKSSDPSVDNDGNALTVGDQYFNTSANELRVWNGSTWQAASTVGGTVTSLNVTGATTLGQNPTLSAGTAYGVAYLNGSKVLTTGSALTFDGSEFRLSRGSSAFARFTETGASVESFFGSYNGVNWLGTTSNHPITFNVNSVEQMRLTSTGLGIGTSSPSVRLQVEGAANSAPLTLLRLNNAGTTGGGPGIASRISFTAGATALGYIQGSNFASGAAGLQFSGDGTNAQATLDSVGNLGLGVTPSANDYTGALQLKWIGHSLTPRASDNLALTMNAYHSGGGWKYGNNGSAAAYIQSASGHAWTIASSGTAGNAISFTQAMTLDASGNLGVGTTSPQAYSGYAVITADSSTNGGVFSVRKAGVVYGNLSATANALTIDGVGSGGTIVFRTGAADTERARINSNGNFQINGDYLLNSTDAQIGVASGSMRFMTGGITSTGGTERARIDSSGVLRVNNTSGGNGWITSLGDVSRAGFSARVASNGQWGAAWHNASDVNVGTIVINSTSTAYNTSSDYRLKENIQPMTGALAKVAALKPVTYKWKADGSDGEGFIAHELQEVVPQCVTGEKDAVDAEGNPVYQGIDTSFLVATLTAAIQELKAELDSVKSELASLKGN